jgi:hypothetical protein
MNTAATKNTKTRSFILSPLSKAFSAKASEIEIRIFVRAKKQFHHHPARAKKPAQTATIGGIQVRFEMNVKNKFEFAIRRALDNPENGSPSFRTRFYTAYN